MRCPDCDGTGADNRGWWDFCVTCRGSCRVPDPVAVPATEAAPVPDAQSDSAPGPITMTPDALVDLVDAVASRVDQRSRERESLLDELERILQPADGESLADAARRAVSVAREREAETLDKVDRLMSTMMPDGGYRLVPRSEAGRLLLDALEQGDGAMSADAATWSEVIECPIRKVLELLHTAAAEIGATVKRESSGLLTVKR